VKKTASQIADQVLEKTARNRAAKEFIQHVLRRHPGTPVKGKSLDAIEESVRYNIPDNARSLQEAAESYRGHLGPERVREALSHRHGPRRGEILIPAGEDYTRQAFPNVPVSGVTFRGNPRPPKGAGPYWGTPHPDVGAHYTHGEKIVPMGSSPSGRLFAYKTPSLKGSTIGPADHIPAQMIESKRDFYDLVGVRNQAQLVQKRQQLLKEQMSHSVADRLRELRQRRGIRRRGHTPRGDYEFSGLARASQELPHAVRYSKNYERIIPDSVRPRAIGQYGVRPSRTAEGLPAFAVQDVSGVPAREMFGDLINKRSPLFRDLR